MKPSGMIPTGPPLSVHVHGLTEDVGCPVEEALPQLVAQDDHTALGTGPPLARGGRRVVHHDDGAPSMSPLPALDWGAP